MEQIILNEQEFNRLKLEVKKNKDKEIIFTSSDDNLNRKVIEKLPIQIILIPLEDRKDYMKQRNSGLNEIIARITKKNKIKIGINLDEIIKSKNKERILGRLKQNIMLCNKNKIKMTFIQSKHKKSDKDLKALLRTLGLHTSLC